MLHADVLGDMDKLYTVWYLLKGEYGETLKTKIQWVMKCFDRPRYFYNMFRMSIEVFIALHDLLVLTYGFTSINNLSSIKS